jgi:hypothetical protein
MRPKIILPQHSTPLREARSQGCTLQDSVRDFALLAPPAAPTSRLRYPLACGSLSFLGGPRCARTPLRRAFMRCSGSRRHVTEPQEAAMPLDHTAVRKPALLLATTSRWSGAPSSSASPTASTGSALPTGATDAPTPSSSPARSPSGSTRSWPAGCCSPPYGVCEVCDSLHSVRNRSGELRNL